MRKRTRKDRLKKEKKKNSDKQKKWKHRLKTGNRNLKKREIKYKSNNKLHTEQRQNEMEFVSLLTSTVKEGWCGPRVRVREGRGGREGASGVHRHT